jgi:hypothetical protein
MKNILVNASLAKRECVNLLVVAGGINLQV